MSSGRKSCSFEVFHNDAKTSLSAMSPLSTREFSGKADGDLRKDVVEKVEEAARRKSEILQQAREKAEAHNQKVKLIRDGVKAKRDSDVATLKETVEMRQKQAEERRQQNLEERVELAKKVNERVKTVQEQQSLEDCEQKLDEIIQDIANKENNRRSIIQSIRESCQREDEKVAEAQRRRATLSKE